MGYQALSWQAPQHHPDESTVASECTTPDRGRGRSRSFVNQDEAPQSQAQTPATKSKAKARGPWKKLTPLRDAPALREDEETPTKRPGKPSLPTANAELPGKRLSLSGRKGDVDAEQRTPTKPSKAALVLKQRASTRMRKEQETTPAKKSGGW